MITLEDVRITYYRDYVNPLRDDLMWDYMKSDIDKAKESALKYIYEQETK